MDDDGEHSETTSPHGWLGKHSRSSSPPLGPFRAEKGSRSKDGSIRFLVMQTSILPRKFKVGILDGYRMIQFGRDNALVGTDIPRVRLKEMEVSKVHATVYWDEGMNEWAVVDMGSKHGTFLKSPGLSSTRMSESAKEGYLRLSLPRTASFPRKLRHFDLLTIGSTTFQVHIHEDKFPCTACSPTGNGEEIPLFPPGHVLHGTKRSRDDVETNIGATRPTDRKKALNMLKRTLLVQHDERSRPTTPQPVDAEGIIYVDRSARRRALHPDSHSLFPSTSDAQKSDTRSKPHSLLSTPFIESSSTEISQPPAPLPATNIGHRLLTKQGWKPGTSLGLPATPADTEGRIKLVEPLNVSSTEHRAGIGVIRSRDATRNQNAKRKRWNA